MNTIPIVFAFDENLILAAGVCFTSLLRNAAPDTFYDIFILQSPGCNLQDTALSAIPDHYPNCKMTFRTVEGEFEGAYKIRGITEMTYYRLVIPDLIPEYDKVLYSDVDVVFREDLGRYYQIDLGNYYLAGVNNGVRFRPDMQQYVASLGLDPNNGYFYAGNLIINTALMRQDRMTDVFREYAKKNYYDQDMAIINLACNGRILSIGPSYCLTNNIYNLIVNQRDKMEQVYGKEEIEHALKRGIVHYNGPKPWIKACINMDVWWYYYRLSIFFDEKFCRDFWDKESFLLERVTLTKRIKMLLRYPLDRKSIKK